MSLEEALHANTAALNKLAELFSVGQIETIVTAQAAVADSNTASNTSMHPHVLESPSGEVAVPTAQAPVGEPVAADVIPYQKVQDIVTKACCTKGVGKHAVIDALESLGLKTAKEAKVDQYADIIAACEALIASSEVA